MFSVPYDGGSPITGYTVVSNPFGGVDSNAGSLLPVHVITGLVNGKSYEFAVYATNAVGNGPVSAYSNSVVPSVANGSGPALFYSDLDSGPGTGGENNLGVYVTITGERFGLTQGSSTVTVGNGTATVFSWSPTQIVFQPGPGATTGNIVVNVPGSGASNGIPFIVRGGRIHYAALTAKGSGNGSTSANAMSVNNVYAQIQAGDTYYFLGGQYTGRYGTTTWADASWAFDYTKSGAANNSVALVGYPGQTAIFGGYTAQTSGTVQAAGITTIQMVSVPSGVTIGMNVQGGGDQNVPTNNTQIFPFGRASGATVTGVTPTSITVASPSSLAFGPNTTLFFNVPSYTFYPRTGDILFTYTTASIASGALTMTVSNASGISAGMALVGAGQGGTGIGNFLGSITVASVAGSVVTFNQPIPCAFPANWYFGFAVAGTINNCANYITLANLTCNAGSGGGSCISTGSYASNPPSLAGSGAIGTRIVNNNLSVPYADATAIVVIGGNYTKILGNHFSLRSIYFNQSHCVYQDDGACFTEVAWNWFDNTNAGFVIQYHMDNCNGQFPQAFDEMGILCHDNLITSSNDSCRNITVTNLGSSSYGSFWNNICVNTGFGVTAFTNYNSGTWNVFNNTFYNVNVQAAIQIVGTGSGYANGANPTMYIYNNIIWVASSADLYLQYAQPTTARGSINLSNNLYYGGGTGPNGSGLALFTDTGAVNGQPTFVNPQIPGTGTLNGGDFHLQAGSLGIGTGTSAVSAVVTTNGDGIPWGTGPYNIGAY